jgi:hypothetical protein
MNAHTQKIQLRDFGQIAPGKTHKGKTSERGRSLLFLELREKCSFREKSYSALKQQTYLKIHANTLEQCHASSSKTVQVIHTVVWLLQHQMLYGVSRILCTKIWVYCMVLYGILNI